MVNSVSLNTAYKRYKTLMQNSANKIGEELGTKIIFEPTSKIICKNIGITKEAANGLNTLEFLKAVYTKLKEKGYKIPNLFLSEDQLPREFNTSGLQMGNWNIFMSSRLDVSKQNIIIF